MKCKKCNSTNIKINYDKVYTSIPSMYEYKCHDCGCFGYINCDETYKKDFDEDEFQKINDSVIQNIEKPTEQKNENKFVGGLTGWICPKCGRCYSPFTSMCSYCSNGDMFTVTCNYTGTTDLNNIKW